MSNEKVTKLNPRHIQEAKKILASMSDEAVEQVVKFIAGQFIEEIEQGLEGEVNFEDAPFFELVNRIYEESQPRGCYFCDRSIDGNAEPFDYPNKTKLCLSCMLKVANLLVAFGIDPDSLFDGMGMGDRKIQPVIYEDIRKFLPSPDDTMH